MRLSISNTKPWLIIAGLFSVLHVLTIFFNLMSISESDNHAASVDLVGYRKEVANNDFLAKKAKNMHKVEDNKLRNESSLNLDPITVLDIGASKGGSVLFLHDALKQLKKKNLTDLYTLGIDNNPSKVRECNHALSKYNNLRCMHQDALELSDEVVSTKISSSSIKGVTMWHVLEHMPTCQLAKKMWTQTANVVTKFSSFRGPEFDNEHILNQQYGYHRYYANWTGHTCHFNSTMLQDAILSSSSTSNNKKLYAYLIVVGRPITSSSSTVLLLNGSARDSQHYNPEIHPKKKNAIMYDLFDTVFYEEMRACAIYDELSNNSHNYVSLYSALCLKDAMSIKPQVGTKVVSCLAPGADDTSASFDNCAKTLKQIVANTIKKYPNNESPV